MKKKRQKKYLILLLILLTISIGYAVISTTLNINGTALLGKNSWDVYWKNAAVTEGSVSSELPDISEDQGDPANTKVSWEVTLDMPGDFYEFTVDAVNEGTIDAMILDLAPAPSELPDYIKYEITYDDGEPLEQFHALRKAKDGVPTTETFRIRVEFLDTITPKQMNEVPEGGISYKFTYGLPYGLADSRAIDRPINNVCPGKNCIYAMYSSTYADSDDNYYSINIGDTLPLEFATKGGTATTNYFGGPTRNYDELKIEYDEYKCGTYYITNLEDIDASCQLNQKVSFKPKAFNGVILEKNTNTVEKLYTCMKYKNDIYCYESETNRTFDDMYAIYDDVVSIFGEYDSTTELGCSKINENRLDRFSIDCYYIDGDDNISLTVRSKHAVLNVDGISSNISYSVGNGLGGPEHIEQY